MKDRTPRPDRANATNQRPATCEHCGADIAPGRGFVWWCDPKAAVCEVEAHVGVGGAHIRCRDPKPCHGRATKAVGGKRKRKAPATPWIPLETHAEAQALPSQHPEAIVAPECAQGPLRRSGVMVPGPPNGTYVGGPERRDCPRGHSDSRLSAGIVREFVRTGIDEYVCDGCCQRHWVWRCCGHVALEAPIVSWVYRDTSSAVCPGCGKNRFERGGSR